jgi:uncharacterized protein YbjT (DUF2867 family)
MQATKTIAVAGATGRVGRHIADVLSKRGHEVVAISRSRGVDVVTRDGLADALQGVEIVVDATTSPSPAEREATAFFTTAARNLHAVGEAAGVKQIIGISIINTDRFTNGYGAAKVVHEKALEAGPVPATILRASQFHEFVEQLLEWGRQGDASYVPKMRTQLVAARTVAETVADLATNGSADGQVPELAGPREESLVDCARLLVERRGLAVRVEEVNYPDAETAEVYESGALLPGPGATVAGPTFAEWLSAT